MTPLSHNRQSFFDLRRGDVVMVGKTPYIAEKACRGGMGFVLLLRKDCVNAPQRIGGVHGLKLALKSVLPETADKEGLALFRRELTVWAGFRHPNIVGLNEILDAKNDGWIAAMDWRIGSIRDIMANRKLITSDDGAHIIGDILDGLEYAFDKDQVLHLDLKPENVLYDLDIGRGTGNTTDSIRASRFMISDWGLASIKQPQLNAIAALPVSSSDATRTFNNVGTLLYMAPERFIRGFRSSTASDIFSLGMIYMELLTGTLPFRAGIHPVESLVSKKYFADAEAILKRKNVPSSIRMIILSMLSPVANDRPSSYKELRSSLIVGVRRTKGLFSAFYN